MSPRGARKNHEADQIIRSKAPLRLSFAGGGTDVSPYVEERGGCVVSATINRFAYASIVPGEGRTATIRSLDFNSETRFDPRRLPGTEGKLGLLKAVVRNFRIRDPFRMYVHCDAPPGTGLGSSSAIVVATIGAIKRWRNVAMTDYEIADRAFEIERKDMGIQGGMQDQYAATFGGFNFIEFSKGGTVVNPLRMPQEILDELEYRLLLCYLGSSRQSSSIIQRQVRGYVEGRTSTVHALDETKALALEMKRALLLGRLDDVGELLDRAWAQKKEFTRGITSRRIDSIYRAARGAGAQGGKLTGAGGGGFMVLLCEFSRKRDVAREVERRGCQVVNFGFEKRGLRDWTVLSGQQAK